MPRRSSHWPPRSASAARSAPLAFAKTAGKTPAQILALFEGGKGWGRIKHELGLSIGPGIGWIMGGGDHDKHGSQDGSD